MRPQAENHLQTLSHSLESDAISTDLARLQQVCTEISLTETQIEQLYLRWDVLHQKMQIP